MKKAVTHHSNGQKHRNEYTSNFRYCKSDAVKQLERMADDEARQRYPNTPPQWLAPRRFRDDTANSLTKCIITFLKIAGWQAERINNTGRPLNKILTFTDVVGNTRTIGRYEWIKGTGTIGTADISATIAGKSVKIEVKTGRDRQSKAQKEYQHAVEKSGGVYFIASSFAEFLNLYNQTFQQ
jgi:hypothetical protein